MLMRVLSSVLVGFFFGYGSTAKSQTPLECQARDQNVRSGNLNYGAGPNGACITVGQCHFTLPPEALRLVRADLDDIPGELTGEGGEPVRRSDDLQNRLGPFGAIFNRLIDTQSICYSMGRPPPPSNGVIISLPNTQIWAWVHRDGVRCITLLRRPSPRHASAVVLTGTGCPNSDRLREIVLLVEPLWQDHADWLAAVGCRWGLALQLSSPGEVASAAMPIRQIGVPARTDVMQIWSSAVLTAARQTTSHLVKESDPVAAARSDTVAGRAARWLSAATIRYTFAAPAAEATAHCARPEADEAEDALRWMALQEASREPVFRGTLFRAERARP
jgi:hypothetical protein